MDTGHSRSFSFHEREMLFLTHTHSTHKWKSQVQNNRSPWLCTAWNQPAISFSTTSSSSAPKLAAFRPATPTFFIAFAKRRRWKPENAYEGPLSCPAKTTMQHQTTNQNPRPNETFVCVYEWILNREVVEEEWMNIRVPFSSADDGHCRKQTFRWRALCFIFRV